MVSSKTSPLALWLLLGCNSPQPQPAPPVPPLASVSASPAAVPAAPSAPAELVPTAQAAPTPPRPALAPVQIPDDMAEVPGGEFTMGANDEGEMDERPAHRVSVEAFLLDKTEVTNEAYLECVEAKVCQPASSLQNTKLVNGMPHVFKRPTHPVVGVSWDDAKTYCEWKGRRLPTEAEWERTARADDNRRYVWGNDEPDPKKHGVFGGRGTTQPVGSYPEGKSAYGHLDLAGNVWEWVADDYDPYAYVRPTNDRGVPGTCEQILEAQNELRKQGKQGFTGSNPIPSECEKVLRGGAYNYRVNGLRNSNRVHHPARFRIAVAGFRCARDLRPTSPETPVRDSR